MQSTIAAYHRMLLPQLSMTPHRLDTLLQRIHNLRIGVIGDFSLDRYFEIDPTAGEISIETNLPVHNVSRVRCQPGAAGNITANLAAYGASQLWPVGYYGDDGEGFELRRSLSRVPKVSLDHFHQTPERLTFTYSKPLLLHPGRPPEELARLDIKNRTPTPQNVEQRLITSLETLAPKLDALIVMDQAGMANMGAVTPAVLQCIDHLAHTYPRLTIMADSRHGLSGFPHLIYKMNAAEFSVLTNTKPTSQSHLLNQVETLANQTGHPLFVTMAEQGMIGAAPQSAAIPIPAIPLRGPIDIVGAGDTVTATLALALAADATIMESMQLAQAAASLVVHQLGTTGTPDTGQLRHLLAS